MKNLNWSWRLAGKQRTQGVTKNVGCQGGVELNLPANNVAPVLYLICMSMMIGTEGVFAAGMKQHAGKCFPMSVNAGG